MSQWILQHAPGTPPQCARQHNTCDFDSHKSWKEIPTVTFYKIWLHQISLPEGTEPPMGLQRGFETLCLKSFQTYWS